MKKIFIAFFFAILLILPSTAIIAASTETCITKPTDDSMCGQNYSCMEIGTRTDCLNCLCSGGATRKCCPNTPGTTNNNNDKSSADTVSLTNPLTGNNTSQDIPTILGGVIKKLVAIVGALAFAVFIYGGLQIMISPGNPDGVKKGTSAIKYAALGLLIIFSSYAVVNFLISAITNQAS